MPLLPCCLQRGWTTWSLASVDQRVIAIAPLVFSLLNMGDVSSTKWKRFKY